jgi:hypothetical protein
MSMLALMLTYRALIWAVCGLFGTGAALVALKYFKLSPVWALVVGMAVFAGLQFPIETHAVMHQIPLPPSN